MAGILKASFSALPIVFLLPPLSMAQCHASVSGKVIDGGGTALAEANVALAEIQPRPLPNRYFGPFVTDSSGEFHATVGISGPGTFFLSAEKESAGYPSARLAFYLDRDPPEFSLDCNATRTGLTVRLGSKAAYIQRVTVLDAHTGRAVNDATITLRRVSSPLRKLPASALFIKASANLAPPTTKYSGLAVPSKVGVTYQVSAPGHITSAPTAVRLRPLEDLDLTVKLKPAPPSALSPVGNRAGH